MGSEKPKAETKESVIRRLFGQVLTGNAMTTRAELFRNMFDERRDIDDECGYPKELNAMQYRYMYDREGIATRIVSVYPEESWREDPEIYEVEGSDKTAWEATLELVFKEHNVMHYLVRIDELSGIGTYGVLLLGIDDGKNLDEPVEGVILEGVNAGRKKGFDASVAMSAVDESTDKAPTKRASDSEFQPAVKQTKKIAAPVETDRHLLYLRAVDESLVEIAEWETDATSRRFGMPKFYNVKLNDPRNQSAGTSPDLTSARVHWTRIIHVADNTKSSEIFGTPRMQNVFNRLYDLRKLLGGSAEMFWKGAFPGFSFEVNPDLTDVEFDAASIREEFASYANGLQRYLAVNGVSAKSLAVQVASPDDHVTVQLKAIAIAMKCPLRIFMGSEAAHLASTQDQKTWNGRLKHRQKQYLTPKIIRPFIDRLIAIGVLPEPETGTYEVEWPDMDVATDQEKATVADLLVKAIASYMQSGMDILIPPFEFLTIFIGLDNDQAKAIVDAAEHHLANEDLVQQIKQQVAIDTMEQAGQSTSQAPNNGNGQDPKQAAKQTAKPNIKA